MRTPILTASLAAGLALALGCGKPVNKDTSRVIASAGGDKITESDFKGIVQALAPDATKAAAFLTDPAAREARAQLAEQLAMQKAILAYAKLQGLDKDPAVQRQIEGAEAQAYFQSLLQKRLAGAEPTEAQLKALYDERIAALKAQGQTGTVPPFDQVKGQLPTLWRQQRQQEAAQELQKEIRTRIPVTLADDFKPATAPAQ
ncbi:MAG TPA: SurA N-terminal domain-containing protein [Holophagaceae bacterium]